MGGFIAKLDPAGSAFVYLTYLTSSSLVFPLGIATDVIVAGTGIRHLTNP